MAVALTEILIEAGVADGVLNLLLGPGVAVVPASVRALRQDGVHYLRLRNTGAWTDVRAAVRDDNGNPTARDLQERFHAKP